MNELPTEDAALERLRRARSAPDRAAGPPLAEPTPGFALGRRWAMADAHPNELDRLAALSARHGLEGGPAAAPDDGPPAAPAPFNRWLRELTIAMLGVPDLDVDAARAETRHFWLNRVGYAAGRGSRGWFGADFLGDFARGALEFWRAAQARL